MSDHIERACFNCACWHDVVAEVRYPIGDLGPASSLLHHEDDCTRDRLELLREALRGVPGPEDATPCGCTWKRVSNWHYRGAILNGDILTKHCDLARVVRQATHRAAEGHKSAAEKQHHVVRVEDPRSRNMKVVYIIGPFRGKSHWEVAENVRNAERLGLEVAKLGAMPLIPHKNTENFDGLLTDEFWIEGTKELLRRADAAITVAAIGIDYTKSEGERGRGTRDGGDPQATGVPLTALSSSGCLRHSEMYYWRVYSPERSSD